MPSESKTAKRSGFRLSLIHIYCLELTWRFEADGFLKQMVRNTMGLLVAVGRGKLEPADIPGILDACDRRIAPLTAPACGLTMKKVWYDDMFPLAASGHEGA